MSQKYFGTDGIRGRVGQYPVTAEFALHLGWAAGTVLARYHHKPVVAIGKDSRLSGDMLESALISGFTCAGVNVIQLGVLPTPGVAFYVNKKQISAGVVISASHNPFHDNGIKFFSDVGQKLSDDKELEIEAWLDKSIAMVDVNLIGSVRQDFSAVDMYAAFCLNSINVANLDGDLKVVIDTANGATSATAKAVFNQTDMTVVFINDNPNGNNINLDSGAVNLASLKKAVQDHNADIGFAFDGDGDRCMAVDSHGQTIDGDDILYLLAKNYTAKGFNIEGVVGTLMTNFGIEKQLKNEGLQLVRAKVGDRHVLEAMKQKKWLLGGESSGHIICQDANTTGDGIIAALKVLEMLSTSTLSINQLLEPVQKTPQVLVNVPLNKRFSQHDMDAIKPQVNAVEKELGQTGRVLLRPSGTEPVLRVMVEAQNRQHAHDYAHDLADVIKKALT